MTTQLEKGNAFKALHDEGCFIMANFWDPGSAVILERLGFQALASTSAGFAQSIGQLDSAITLEDKLEHCRQVAAVTQAPISVDFEHGFADSPEEAAANLLKLAATGVVGASIEDYSRTEIYAKSLATERIQACAEAVASLDFPFMLTARAENLIRGVNDLEDTLARLQSYEAAGADVLYAPGLASAEQIEAAVAALDKPINVLAPFLPDKKFAEIAELGARRITLGSAIGNYALANLLDAANRMLEDGDFSWCVEGASGKVLYQLLKN